MNNFESKYLIRYPSGRILKLKGMFKLEVIDSMLVPMVHYKNNTSIALDQRAIIENGGKIVYSPRRNLDGLHPEMTKWLIENPHWKE